MRGERKILVCTCIYIHTTNPIEKVCLEGEGAWRDQFVRNMLGNNKRPDQLLRCNCTMDDRERESHCSKNTDPREENPLPYGESYFYSILVSC